MEGKKRWRIGPRRRSDEPGTRPARLQLSNEQIVIVALLLVILFVASMLYCLGFASLALRQNWPLDVTEPATAPPLTTPALPAAPIPDVRCRSLPLLCPT